MLAVTFTVNLMVLAAEMGGVSLALQFLTDGASSGRPFRSPSSWALQAGVDGTLHENEAGTLTGGITFHAHPLGRMHFETGDKARQLFEMSVLVAINEAEPLD